MAKRIFDILLSSLGLIISAPLWVIIGLAIWLEDRGPILYFQDRGGKDGKSFKCIKFRSMIMGASNGLYSPQAIENDSRVTRVGKFLRATAMDELPQLVNIFMGDMSFVGPRALPLREIEVHDGIERDISDYPGFKERSAVRPGLTGIAQVYSVHDVPREIKYKYDLWYINNRSFFLDIYLIMISFIVTFSAKWETRQNKFAFIGKGLKKKVETDIFGTPQA